MKDATPANGKGDTSPRLSSDSQTSSKHNSLTTFNIVEKDIENDLLGVSSLLVGI
jgi:hypothetical protein